MAPNEFRHDRLLIDFSLELDQDQILHQVCRLRYCPPVIAPPDGAIAIETTVHRAKVAALPQALMHIARANKREDVIVLYFCLENNWIYEFL